MWSHARSRGLTIVTRDWDFLQLSTVRGAPPKVIWIRVGNCSVGAVENVLRKQFVDVRRFEENSSATLLIIE